MGEKHDRPLLHPKRVAMHKKKSRGYLGSSSPCISNFLFFFCRSKLPVGFRLGGTQSRIRIHLPGQVL
jgi:hypothetical protein